MRYVAVLITCAFFACCSQNDQPNHRGAGKWARLVEYYGAWVQEFLPSIRKPDRNSVLTGRWVGSNSKYEFMMDGSLTHDLTTRQGNEKSTGHWYETDSKFYILHFDDGIQNLGYIDTNKQFRVYHMDYEDIYQRQHN